MAHWRYPELEIKFGRRETITNKKPAICMLGSKLVVTIILTLLTPVDLNLTHRPRLHLIAAITTM